MPRFVLSFLLLLLPLGSGFLPAGGGLDGAHAFRGENLREGEVSRHQRLLPDTLDGIQRATILIQNRYRGAGSSASARGNRAARTEDRYCSGGEGSVCHGGDPDRGECNAGVPCHPDEEWFVEGLLEEAERHPTSGFLMGQAVYALTKFGRVQEAEELIPKCQAEAWWCEALEGYVLYSYAPLPAVEARFRSALAKSPPDIRCRWEDATWLLGEWDQRVGGVESLPPGREATSRWDCGRRLAASDTLWWWADPLFNQEGNDRWTVHIARAMAAHLSEELRWALRGRNEIPEVRDWNWAMRVRRGPWDSYERLPGWRAPRFWTSEEAAQYHFIPEVHPDDFSAPVWRLQGDIQHEGYTPEYGPLLPIDTQLARFRTGESLLLVGAADMGGTRLRRALDATSYMTLSDGPGSFPIRVEGETRRETPVLRGRAPHGRYMVGMEVMTDLGIGVARQQISPLTPEGPGISDILLLAPGEGGEPASREEAERTMLGSTRLEAGLRLGVFWEVYGAEAGETLSFALTVERETGGIVERLTGLFPGGAEGNRSRVAWTEQAAGGTHPLGITLNLSDLRSGDYDLVLTVAWADQTTMERRRSLSVE